MARMRDEEYNAYEDENWGTHRATPITWLHTFGRVYQEKLAKGWPPNMARIAARRAEAAEIAAADAAAITTEKKDAASVAFPGSLREQLG
jgi:hypothetical protein